MNKTLTTLFALAVASVTAFSHAQEAKGDVEAGKQKIAMCIGCHGIPGYQASFPEVHRVPMISGQNAKYIAAALVAYQKGERKHPTMRGIATSLSEQDIADMAAYYEQHGKKGADLPAKPSREPSVQVAELLKKGACVSCHGDNFAKPIDPSYPKIAGQHSDYLFVALKAYKADARNPNLGRSNAIMGGISKQFTNAELKALANYIGSIDGDLQVVPQSRFR
ncbi:c-type cytochrome [Acidovorax sp. RAC01]|uniref:c-type cytochrome n=1 Tax=Acidovorax sp. RAC01 TaxID=1842533 RepID=UPI00083E7394|nr:c-type cytochrome [Acidovorax sp. RAC01]AOG21748.1 cytochrome c family protein [Acidovorax sp. RAC01]